MAADYDVISSESTTAILSATAALAVTRFGIRTKPSGGTVFIECPSRA